MAVWQTVRVFLSSTFRDMHAERDHLVKVVFPALRARLLPFRVELYDIDLRWGITEEESKSDKVIELCLGQIDECELFLAFIGHCYGSIAKKIPPGLPDRYPVVGQFPGVSVTELELRHNEARPAAAQTHSLELLRKEEALAKVPDEIKAHCFLDEKPEARLRVEDLRTELAKERQGGPPPAQPYSAEWDSTLYDRAYREYGRLDGLGYFGLVAEEWLWDAVVAHLKLPAVPPEVEPLDAEADLHERFLETRTRIYVGRDDVDRELAAFAHADGEMPLLLTGESGLGKSAAMARFVRDFRKEHPEVCVLAHFVGASPRTTSLTGMLKRITEELQRKFTLALPEAESSDEIIRGFLAALAAVPPAARVVLVFDAVNQLDADSRAESLVWLPERLPPNVRVLCSSATGPQAVPHVLSAFAERPHSAVALEPLNDAERRDIVKAVPKLVAKSLDDRQIDALLSNPATRNPLFLIVALEELRGFGSYKWLPDMIARFPRGDDAVTKLFDRVFERLEVEFNAPLVDWTLRLLACSRRGLSGPELEELTSHLGGQADDLYPVLRQLRPYLQSRDELFDFYHLSVRRAVEQRYLKWEAGGDERDPWTRWNPQRQNPAADPSEPEVEVRERLAAFFDTERLSTRSVDELPWQYCQLRAWPLLAVLLGDLSFFAAAWKANESEVRTAWSLAKNVGGIEPFDAYRAALADPMRHDPDAVWSACLFLQSASPPETIRPVWKVLIEHFRTIGDADRLRGALGNSAIVHRALGDLDEALRLDGEKEILSRQHADVRGVIQSLNNQALILRDIGRLTEAKRNLQQVEWLCNELGDRDLLQACYGNQATVCFKLEDYEEVLRLLKEQELICRMRNDHEALMGCLGNEAVTRMELRDYAAALALFEGVEAWCRKVNNPSRIAATLGNRARVLREMGNLSGALRLMKQQEGICRNLKEPAMLLGCLAEQAMVLKADGRPAEAVGLLQVAEAICRELNNPAELSRNLNAQALLFRALGKTSEALRCSREALIVSRRLDNPLALRESLGIRAAILLDAGDLSEASPVLEEEEAICRRLQNTEDLARCLGGGRPWRWASVAMGVRDYRRAAALLEEQESLCRSLKDFVGVQYALGNRAMCLKNLGEPDAALELFREVETNCRRLNNAIGLSTSLSNQALILFAKNESPEALRLLKEDESICRGTKNEPGLAKCLGYQARILLETEQHDRAMAVYLEEAALLLKLNDLRGLADNLGGRAQILRVADDFDGAMKLHREEEAVCRQLRDPNALAISLVNQGLLTAMNLGRPAEGLRLAEQALQIARDCDLAPLVQQIEPMIRSIRQRIK